MERTVTCLTLPLVKIKEDARELEQQEEALGGSGRNSPTLDDPLLESLDNNKMLELIGGRKQLRDRSVNSVKFGDRRKRAASTAEATSKEKAKEGPAAMSGVSIFTVTNLLDCFRLPGFARFGPLAYRS
ncbi:hypothetical protein LTR49_028276 [Elasticomyces elasticus]|nr:hypothetical protein LTR49_028276 [Elasticomyces elasticus]